MLDKIEFSDLYKFLTSIGLIIIASSFLIPWLLLKSDFGILISIEEYNQLIENSKKLANNRIDLNLFILKIIPYLSTALFLIGALLSFYGIKKWKEKQQTVDETDKLKLDELRAKIKELTSKEIDEKAELEIKNEIEENDDEKPVKKVETIKEKENIEELKTNLINMENLFFQKMINYNSFVYDPKSNVKIGDKIQVDIFLKSLDFQKSPDIFVEVKYIQSKLKFSIVQEGLWYLVRAFQNYTKGNSKKLKTYLIVVYKSDIAELSEIKRFIMATNNYLNNYNKSVFNIYVMNDKEAENFDIKKIIQ